MAALTFWCTHWLMDRRYGLILANILEWRERIRNFFILSYFWVSISLCSFLGLHEYENFCCVVSCQNQYKCTNAHGDMWLMSRYVCPDLCSSVSAHMLNWGLASGPFLLCQVTKPLLETSRKGYLAAISASTYSYVSLLKYFAPILNHGKRGYTV